jgi:small nuclear ribonucleoprotein D3
MNVQLSDITMTARNGRVSHLDQVYIRGSHVRFFIVPDMLRLVLYSFYLFVWEGLD